MRLNKNFLVHQTEHEVVIVPTGQAGFSGVVRGNKTFGEILNCLKTDTTPEKIIAKLKNKYEVSDQIIEKDVTEAIDKLKSIGAVE